MDEGLKSHWKSYYEEICDAEPDRPWTKRRDSIDSWSRDSSVDSSDHRWSDSQNADGDSDNWYGHGPERKKKGKSPYDDLPPYGEPWKEKSPWKPNPYEPYKPSEDGWDKWVKHNNWMAKYSPDYSANPESGASA